MKPIFGAEGLRDVVVNGCKESQNEDRWPFSSPNGCFGRLAEEMRQQKTAVEQAAAFTAIRCLKTRYTIVVQNVNFQELEYADER